MTVAKSPARRRCELQTPVRNNYFFGKLLEEFHFELETDYMNQKRFLLNRLVHGYGVVCGLDVVEVGGVNRPDAKCLLRVASGLAIDRHGREIVVPRETSADEAIRERIAQLPPEPADRGAPEGQKQDDDNRRVRNHLLICYRECLAEPAPVHASDCDAASCAPGSVHESYQFKVAPGYVERPCSPLQIKDLIQAEIREQCGGDLEVFYEFCHCELVRLVSRPCPPREKNPCIPLANFDLVQRPDDAEYAVDNVDITIRPIVYANDLLFQLLMSLMYEEPPHRTTK